MKNITIKTIRNKQKQAEKIAELFFRKPKIDEKLEEKKKENITKKFFHFMFFVAFVLIIGGVGGILADRLAIPYISAKFPELNQYDIFKRVNDRVTIIKMTEEVNISEDRATVDAIKKSLPSIVQIFQFPSAEDKNGVYRGAGFIYTSDGYVITSSKNIVFAESLNLLDEKENEQDAKDKDVQKKNVIKVKFSDGRVYSSEIVKKDDKSEIAIIKINKNNLSVLPFMDSSAVELGEKLIILGDSVAEDIISNVKEVSAKSQKRIVISGSLDNTYIGAAVINLKGEIVGMSQGDNIFIPINEINEFAKSAIK